MSDENHHPQVHLKAGLFEDDVDEDLAPLLRLLWEADIDTMSSCQNAGESLVDMVETHPHMAAHVESRRDRAYIDFFNGGIEDFMTLVVKGKPDDEFYYRIYHWVAPGAWGKSMHIHDWEDDGEFRIMGAQVSFPVSDIPLIIECLERAQ